MKIQSVLFLFILSLAGCNFGNAPTQLKPSIFKDTLTYNYQHIHKRAADCGNKADSACTVVKITYPVFKNNPALNDTVKRKVLTFFAPDNKPETSPELMASKFLSNYADSKKDNKRTGYFFTLTGDVNVVLQDSALLAIQYSSYAFAGGAHGISYTGFFNWNPKGNKEITLGDILTAGYQAPLNKIAERIFRKEENLKDTSSLARDYFFKDNKFALNGNYLLTPTGIRFVYNQYEIKPYAAGQTEIIIPYADIKALIRPNAVIAHYIK